ncbi:MAG: chorismate--pyruvate lyase [Lachnospiraceae bacterium]|nr:chorismate--pyruvate lyase [Lachnospiraceae bacterium]
MEKAIYIVDSFDGDYVKLKRIDKESDDLKLVARALLPQEITEGSKLKCEMLQYELLE